MRRGINKYRIIVVLALIIMCLSINHISYATGGSDGGGSSGIDFSMADSFIEAGKSSEEGGISDLTEIGKSFSAIGNILTYIGAGILVGATAYMGILYLISPPEKQAKLKEQLIGLLVSAIVIFGAYYIWKIVVDLLTTTIG